MSSREPFEPELPDHGPAPRWAEGVRRALEADADALDAATRSRLNRARQLALAESTRPRWLGFGGRARLWLPAGAAAALALAFALHPTLPGRGGGAEQAAATGAAEDLELIRQQDSLELYEDQEFYAWLDESASPPG